MSNIQLLAALCFFASVTHSPGDEPTRKTPPLVDAFGDPLPDWAVARMGSTRFRHAGLSDFTYLPDGKTIVTVGSDHAVRYWDVETGRRTKAVALGGPIRPCGKCAMPSQIPSLGSCARASDRN